MTSEPESGEGLSQQPRGGTWRVTARLLGRYLPGETRSVLLGLILALAASAAALLQPWPLKLVLDHVVGNQPGLAWLTAHYTKGRLLVLLCLALLVIELVMGVTNVLSAYLLNSVALRMVFKLRCALFDHVQRLSLSFHETRAVGDSLYRITWDSYCLQAIFSEGLIPGLTAGTTLVGIALVLLSRDWRLAIAAAAVAVPLLVLIRGMDKPMAEQSTKVHEHESLVSSRVQETLTGIRAVQAYGREQYESARFRSQAGASLAANLRLTMVQTASQALVGLILAGGTAAVIWLSARGVMQGRMSAGDLVLLVSYAAMVFKPLETLAYTTSALQNAAAGARRVLAVLDWAPEVAEAPNAITLPNRASGELVFDQVSFGYKPGPAVLRDISLVIPPGSSLALVGPSGAGKTTLAGLLLRFYDPAQGRITLDGSELKGLALSSLRRNVALVTQEPILFAASIRENIAYGRPDATLDQIEAAAADAGAHEFIRRLPQGYETQVAERGATLSSGQRQRLAIARAFLKDAPVLILDEPTSALDVQTEEALVHALERLMKNRTTLIIAHRLTTVRCADRIAVLMEGRIREYGSHEELLERGGLYAQLHRLQFEEPAAGRTEEMTLEG